MCCTEDDDRRVELPANVVDDCTEREEKEDWVVMERVMLSVDDVVLYVWECTDTCCCSMPASL